MKIKVNDLVTGKFPGRDFGIVTRIVKYNSYKLDHDTSYYWAEVLWENQILAIVNVKHLTKIEENYNEEDYKRKLSNT